MPTKAAGFLVGFAGLVTLIGPEALRQLRGQGSLALQLAVLGGAVCYAINAVVARHRPPADPVVAAAGVMIAGSVMMLPVGAVPASAQLLAAPRMPLIAMLALAIVATAIATVVFLRLVTTAGPSFTLFINYLIPVWALLMGIVFLGERPDTRVVIALTLILSGIGLSEAGSRRLVASDARRDAEGVLSAAASTGPPWSVSTQTALDLDQLAILCGLDGHPIELGQHVIAHVRDEDAFRTESSQAVRAGSCSSCERTAGRRRNNIR